ncbi:hypothetical protein FRB99_005028 [Tulasnella sp. 403]|nr:hypothetical protein FRB99_005028 [Tulasnella sp. 403]
MHFSPIVAFLAALFLCLTSLASPTNLKGTEDAYPVAELAARNNGDAKPDWGRCPFPRPKPRFTLPDILDLTHRRVADLIPELRDALPIGKHPVKFEPELVCHLLKKLNHTIWEGSDWIGELKHLPFDEISGGLTPSAIAFKAIDLNTITAVAIGVANATGVAGPVAQVFPVIGIIAQIVNIIQHINDIVNTVENIGGAIVDGRAYEILPPELWLGIVAYLREPDDSKRDDFGCSKGLVERSSFYEPGELHRKDVSITNPSRSLLHLSSTCRDLRRITLPFLFQQIKFYLEPPLSRHPIKYPAIEKVFALLDLKGSGYLDYVRDVTIAIASGRVNFPAHLSGKYESWVQPIPHFHAMAIWHLLPLMRNIRRLQLCSITSIRFGLLDLITSLEFLEELKVVECSVDSEWIPNNISWATPRKLRSLHICSFRNIPKRWIDQLLSSPALTVLVIDSPTYERIGYRPLAELQYLELDGYIKGLASVKEFECFLDSCLNLRTLSIRGIIDADLDNLKVTMPNLKAVLCDIQNIKTLVCRQSGVEVVELHHFRCVAEAIQPTLDPAILNETSTTTCKLVIPDGYLMNLDSTLLITSIFPSLHHLAFSLSGMLDVRDAFPSLQQLGEQRSLYLAGGFVRFADRADCKTSWQLDLVKEFVQGSQSRSLEDVQFVLKSTIYSSVHSRPSFVVAATSIRSYIKKHLEGLGR